MQIAFARLTNAAAAADVPEVEVLWPPLDDVLPQPDDSNGNAIARQANGALEKGRGIPPLL